MTFTHNSFSHRPPRSLARYLTTNPLLAGTAIVGSLVIPGLTAVSTGVCDAAAEKDGISGLDQPALDQVIASRTPVADRLLGCSRWRFGLRRSGGRQQQGPSSNLPGRQP